MSDKTLAELAQQYDVHPTQIADWKSQLLERAAHVFGEAGAVSSEPDLKTLHAKIGQLTLENDFLESALTKAGLAGRKTMIDRTHDLPATRQCQVLDLARSTIYYQPVPTSPDDLALMRRMDELHLEHPFAGSRMLRDLLRLAGCHKIGRKRVRGLMKKMGIEAPYHKPSTSRRHAAHPVYPYLLRGMRYREKNIKHKNSV